PTSPILTARRLRSAAPFSFLLAARAQCWGAGRPLPPSIRKRQPAAVRTHTVRYFEYESCSVWPSLNEYVPCPMLQPRSPLPAPSVRSGYQLSISAGVQPLHANSTPAWL